MGRDIGSLQLGHESIPLLGSNRDGDVMEATEDFSVLPEVKAREVEVGEIVIVTDVEEEVGRTAVVPVLEQFDKGELEEALVERDGSLDIAGEEGKVMQASSRGRRPYTQGSEVSG